MVFEADIDRPLLGSIKRGQDQAFETNSQWVNLDTGEALSTESDTSTFTGRYGYRKAESNFVRIAPNELGRWRIEATITTHGWQALRPATQVISSIQTGPVTVRAFNAPQCVPGNL